MFFDFLIQFAVELARALLLDELSELIRRRARRRLFRNGDSDGAVKRAYHRNRERLLHRLRTGPEEDP